MGIPFDLLLLLLILYVSTTLESLEMSGAEGAYYKVPRQLSTTCKLYLGDSVKTFRYSGSTLC